MAFTAAERKAIVAKCDFLYGYSRDDLLNPNMTRDVLLNILKYLGDASGHRILVTCARSGHSIDGVAGGHGHNPGGDALDLWHADWAKVGDDKILDVIQVLAKWSRKGQLIQQVGLAGYARRYISWVTWGKDFNIFTEDAADHIHVSGILSSDLPVRWGGNLLQGD